MGMLSYEMVQVTPFGENCVLIYNKETKIGAVCDPGGEPNVIISAITELGMKPEIILLTHGHLDHIGAVNEIRDHYSIPVYGPNADDEFLLNSIDKQAHMLRLNAIKPFKPDNYALDQHQFLVGGETITVMRCPGHTPGHVIYYAELSGFCVVGDVIFRNSIGRTDFPRGNFSDLIAHIEDRILIMPNNTTLIPGHGPTTTVSYEKRNNPYINANPLFFGGFDDGEGMDFDS